MGPGAREGENLQLALVAVGGEGEGEGLGGEADIGWLSEEEVVHPWNGGLGVGDDDREGGLWGGGDEGAELGVEGEGEDDDVTDGAKGVPEGHFAAPLPPITKQHGLANRAASIRSTWVRGCMGVGLSQDFIASQIVVSLPQSIDG